MSLRFAPSALLLSLAAPARPAHAACPEVLVRFVDPTPAQIRRGVALGLDVWSEHAGPGDPVFARGRTAVVDAATSAGLALVRVDTDLCAVAAASLHTPTPPSGDASFYEDFRPLSSLRERTQAIASSTGSWATAIEIGASVQGRPLDALILGDVSLPTVVVTGTVHPREWISPLATLWIAEHVVQRHLDAGLLDTIAVVVVPVVNPDGYVYSIDVERFWRKNRGGLDGVDLNRNFEYGFGGPGADADPESPFYHGDAAFSEPETAALRDLVLSLPNVVAHLDVHAYGALILYPWQGSTRPSSDQRLFSMLGEAMADAAHAIEAQDYRAIQGGTWYPASGTSSDWFYGSLGIPSITVELRPRVELMGPIGLEGFVLPADQIEPASREATAAADVMLDWARDEFGEPPAPGGATDTSGDDGETSGGSSTGGAGSATTSTGATSMAPDTTDGDGTGDESGASSVDLDASADDGCGCANRPQGGETLALGWLALLALARRRRHALRRR